MWEIDVSNIAGIRNGQATLQPGLNTVQASNFQGKSSFIAAIQAVLGTTGRFSVSHPLTEDEEEGAVTLTTDDDEYEVTLKREDNAVSRSGKPYLTDETDQVCANLFAALGEDNPIRAAVRNGEDLTDYLQAPLNIEEINAQIKGLKRQRDDIKTEMREAEKSADKLPTIEQEITQLEETLEDLREERDELSEQLPEGGVSDELSEKLSTKQGDLSDVDRRISQLEGKIDRLKNKLEEKQAELDDLEVPSEPELNADVEEKESRISELEQQISLLQDLQRANQQIIDQNQIELVTDIDRGISEDTIDCWVCGEETTTSSIETRLQALQEKLNTLRSEKSELESEVQDINSTKREIRQKENRRDDLEDAIGRIKVDIEEAKSDLEQAKSKKEDLEAEVAELEETVEESSEEVNEEFSDINSEISRKERTLERKKNKLQELEAAAEKAETLEDQVEELSNQIAELREQKKEKQRELEKQFNSALEDVIDKFAPGFDGGRLIPKSEEEGEDFDKFELTIVRDGRETSLENLSEGERELVGIVVAIAGYRTFNVDDRVPVILIDGISQLSSENLQLLLDYLADASEMLVTTAYPEAGDLGGETIDPSDWDVVSDEESAAA